MKTFGRNGRCLVLLSLLFASSSATVAHAQSWVSYFNLDHCSAAQTKKVAAAVNEAIAKVKGSHTDSKVTRWFGTRRNDSNWAGVMNVKDWITGVTFCLIADGAGGAAGLNPTCVGAHIPPVTINCQGGLNVIAHVNPGNISTIYLDNGFWGLPLRGSGSVLNGASQAGAIIHECSHMAGTTHVWASRGLDPNTLNLFDYALSLASEPNTAIFNADNWEFFYQNL